MALTSYFDYKVLKEFAAPGRGSGIGTGSSINIEFDRVDNSFLSQFKDSKWWPHVLHQRTIMLHDALIKLQKIRDEIAGVERVTSRNEAGEKSLRVIIKSGGLTEKIINFLKTGKTRDGSELTDEQKDFVRKRHTFANGKEAIPLTVGSKAFWDPKGIATIQEEDINELAEDDAFEIAKKQTENPEDVVEDFKSNRKAEFKGPHGKKIEAFPHLNKLYHKWERTRGEFHDPRSGLFDPKTLKELESEGHPKGEYSIDLSHPGVSEEGKRYTRGLDFYEFHTWKKSLDKWIRHSAYNHYENLTDLPAYRAALRRKEDGESEGVFWLPMDGKKNRLKIKDPKVEWIKQALTTIVESEMLEKAHKEGKVLGEEEKKEEIENTVKARLISMICKGEIKAHPVPGPVPVEFQTMASNRSYEIADANKNVCQEPLDKMIDLLKTGKIKIKEQYVFIPHELINGKYIPILPKSNTLKKPIGVQKEVDEDGDGEEEGSEGKGKEKEKVLPFLSDEEKENIIKNADNFTPISIIKKGDPKTIETGERTGVLSTGPTPTRKGQKYSSAYANYKLASQYHKKEFLDKLITPISMGGMVSDEHKPAGTNPDFLKGIEITLLKPSASGGADYKTRRRLFKDELLSLHTAVYNYILGSHIDSVSLADPKGRNDLASSYISSWLQGNVEGMVRRRQRKKIGAVSSFSKGEQDIDPEQKEKEHLKSGDQKQSREYLQKAIYELEKLEVAQPAKPELGDPVKESNRKLDIIKQFKATTLKKEEDIFDVLVIYLSKKFQISEEEAKKQIKSWKLSGLSEKEMFDKVEAGGLRPVQKTASPMVRAKMVGGASPLLKRAATSTKPTTQNVPPVQNVPTEETPPEQQVDWNLYDLTISERIEYFKNKLRS